MTMDPNAPQAGGFMGGMQNTLGGIGDAISGWFQPWRDAPLTGGAEDPFSNLSRQQRMMLGFAALRDAGAALQGQEGSYFSDALGVFNQGRERERLRRQGALQNLAALQQARAYAAFSGDQQALSAFDAALADVYAQLGVGGAPSAASGAAPSAPGVAPTTAAPTAAPTGGTAAQPPQTTQQRIDDIDAELARLASGSMLGVDTSAQMQLLMDERNRLSDALQETVVTGQETAAAVERAQTVELPRIEAALGYLVQGTDENGNPVIDPQFTGPLGMEAFRRLNPTAYNDLQNILNTVRSGQLLETLQQVTTGALSEGEIAVFGGTRGTLDINDPAGTVRTLMQIQRELQRLLAEQSSGESAQPDNPFREVN